MYCTKCGKENKDTAKFCTTCGFKQVHKQEKEVIQIEESGQSKKAENISKSEKEELIPPPIDKLQNNVPVRKVSWIKFFSLLTVHLLLFSVVIFLCYLSPGAVVIYTTSIIAAFVLLTIPASVFMPRSIEHSPSNKEMIGKIRICFFAFFAILSSSYMFCNESMKSQSSIYMPIYRALKESNIPEINNEDLLLNPRELVFFLDISGTMQTKVNIENWHINIINKLKSYKWQQNNDDRYIHVLDSLSSLRKISILAVSLLKSCSVIIESFDNMPASLKSKSNFSVHAFSNIVYNCATSMQVERLAYTKENVALALHNIIINPIYNRRNNTTNFVAVFESLCGMIGLDNIRSSYDPTKLSAFIISDFIHDNNNGKNDSSYIVTLIDSLQKSNVNLNLISENQESPESNLLNIKKIVRDFMSDKAFSITSINGDIKIYSYRKSKKNISLLYDNPNNTTSSCKFINIDSIRKYYTFQKLGNVVFGEDYYLIDEAMIRKSLSGNMPINTVFSKSVYINYIGNIFPANPNPKLLITDNVPGICVEYDISFMKSLNKANAWFLLAVWALVSFFALLFWVAYINFKINKDLNVICKPITKP